MSISVCPSEIVEAPVVVVWKLLTNPTGWGYFYDVRVVDVDPPGSAKAGQRVSGQTGSRFFHFGVSFLFTRVDPETHCIELEVRLPFAMTVKEKVNAVALSANQCRVNYHCAFELPRGLKGILLGLVLHRGIRTGPVDSIRRLKQAAETEARITRGDL